MSATVPSRSGERVSIEMAAEARRIFGVKAGAEVWFLRDLPHTPAMDELFAQLDLFHDGAAHTETSGTKRRRRVGKALRTLRDENLVRSGTDTKGNVMWSLRALSRENART